MKFSKFLQIYGHMPLIETETFPLYSQAPEQLRSQVSRWIQKGWIVPLKRGLYIFSDVLRFRDIPMLYIANRLISPSYISMEYALGYYGLIPEKVVMVTSVTTKKTSTFKNDCGIFKYYSIKKNLFCGYSMTEEGEQKIFIASPEKALLDYFYFNQVKFKGHHHEFEEMRFQNIERLNHKTLLGFKHLYGSKMRNIIMRFVQYIKEFDKKYKKLQG